MRLLRFCVAGALVVALATVARPGAIEQASLEYDVKAAFVLNFVRFVEWPAASRQPPLRMCVVAPNPFGNKLADLVAGEHWQGAQIEVRMLDELRSVGDCHLVYVPEVATTRFRANAALLAERPVLTVGEHSGFLADGGMIQLFVVENRVRFSINLRAAELGGLQISSRLLRLAHTVVGAPRT